MGWLISLIMLAVCICSKQTISPETMFVTAGLFAIAGSIGLSGTSIASSLKSDTKEKQD